MDTNGKIKEKIYLVIRIIFWIIIILAVYSFINKDNTEKNNPELEDRFYYNQLDTGYKKNGKIIYDKLYENKENLKNGNYEIKVPITVYSENNISEACKYVYTSFLYAKAAFFAENPDMFFIDEDKLNLDIDTYDIIINCGDNENYYIDGINSKSDVINMEAKLKESVSPIMKELENLDDDYSKIKKVHDYLCETITYDKNANNRGNIYGALVEKKCVCEGYALAFQYFMNQLNIESVLIYGEAFGFVPIGEGFGTNHAWNYVKLNNNWYAVDTTWDDNIQETTYAYFLKGSKTMEKNHSNDWAVVSPWNISPNYVSEDFTYPVLNSNDY